MEHYLTLLNEVYAKRRRLQREIEDLTAARDMVLAYPELEGPTQTLSVLCGKSSFNTALCRLMQMDARYVAQEMRLVQLIEKTQKKREAEPSADVASAVEPASEHANAHVAKPVDKNAVESAEASAIDLPQDATYDDKTEDTESNDTTPECDDSTDISGPNAPTTAWAGPRIRAWDQGHEAIRGDP